MSMSMMTTGTSHSMSSATHTHTNFAPGYTAANGVYVPTSKQKTAYQAARIPWAAQVKYGYYTLAVLAGLLGVFTVLNLLWVWRLRSRRSILLRVPGYRWVAATARGLSYPRLKPHRVLDAVWSVGAMGPNWILLGGLLFSTAITFINRYYYYLPFYGSSPLYLRSEWVAMACMPFLYALGSKRNFIAFLTGVSHARLQVLHQGIALIFTYMSLVHTGASCVRAHRERGIAWTTINNRSYWTGWLALAPLFVLFFAALPVFRRAAYEVFWWVHMVMALFFLGAMGLHGWHELDSDAYTTTAIVVWFYAILHRVVRMLLDNPLPHLASARIIDDSTVCLSIPTLLHWKTGSHIFIRILEVQPLQSHPFSILTARPAPSASDKSGRPASRWDRGWSSSRTLEPMEFVIRRRDGLTRALWKHVSARGGACRLRCLLDGPYGGGEGLETGMDGALILAGGSGISGVFGLMQRFAAQDGNGEEEQAALPKNVKLVWTFRRLDALEWVDKQLETLLATSPHISVQLHITGDELPPSVPDATEHKVLDSSAAQSEVNSEIELLPVSVSAGAHAPDPAAEMNALKKISSAGGTRVQTVSGRPDVGAEVDAWVREQHGALAVIVCGTESFTTDASNAVARVQRGIVRGRYPDIAEVVLETERFGW